MEEIKERFETFVDRDEYKGHVHRDTTAEEMLAFIQSEIDLAVSKERERIVELLNKYAPEKEKGYGVSPIAMTLDDHKRNFRNDIINLINTK